MNSSKPILMLTAMTALSLLAGCAVGPVYKKPEVANTASFKEAEGWMPAAPADAMDRGAWWVVFGDPVLNDLAAQVAVSNQNVAAATAAYAQARALVGQQQAALLPTVSLAGSATRADSSRGNANYQVSIGGTWEPDVWGRLRGGVNASTASAQASAGDLASATLSAQGELATNYFLLRQTESQRTLLIQSIEGYQRVLQITQNRYAAGVVPKTDVLQAQTTLANAQAEETGLGRQYAQLEHAIAVLVGQAPAAFTLKSVPWQVTIPVTPVGIPSALLQRRPDIAAAERRVAAANAQIGIERAAYFPTLNLNATGGSAAGTVAALFGSSASLWSFGLSAAQTIFNGGLTAQRVAGAEAFYDQAVAHYRQTVLTAFQDVEDQLAASRVLMQQEAFRRAASDAADQAEQQVLNRYRAGQVGFVDVVTAQATALTARRALVQLQSDRQTASIALIQALGGGWQTKD
jgi:NodT family efflux transporter outer membrane factor (OMF) lipoprotein